MKQRYAVYVIEWRTKKWREWKPVRAETFWDRNEAFMLLRKYRASGRGLPYDYRVAKYARVA